MGTITDTFVAYAQPLLDSASASPEGADKALAISQLCWNLALLPEEDRGDVLAKVKSTLSFGDDEFVAFRNDVIDPMIRRHLEMFPRMHQPSGTQVPSRTTAHTGKYPGTARNAACPCNSGLKYKRCCARS
jgi:hypothetical protein